MIICIQNIKSINIFTEVIINNKNKIFEELLINSIKILKNYNAEYLLEFMENKNFILKNLDNRVYWHLLLEDNNSALYFDEGTFYINIEAGEMNHYNITDLKKNLKVIIYVF